MTGKSEEDSTSAIDLMEFKKEVLQCKLKGLLPAGMSNLYYHLTKCPCLFFLIVKLNTVKKITVQTHRYGQPILILNKVCLSASPFSIKMKMQHVQILFYCKLTFGRR